MHARLYSVATLATPVLAFSMLAASVFAQTRIEATGGPVALSASVGDAGGLWECRSGGGAGGAGAGASAGASAGGAAAGVSAGVGAGAGGAGAGVSAGVSAGGAAAGAGEGGGGVQQRRGGLVQEPAPQVLAPE